MIGAPLLNGILAADNTPRSKSLGVVSFHEYSLVKLEEKTSFVFNYRQLPNWDGRLWDQTSLRARYRFLPWLKVGAGSVWQKGERHNEDWVKDPSWGWRDTFNRVERLSQLEIIPRWFWKSSVLEWRQTISHNNFLDASKLISRLGVNFHNLRIESARISFITQVEEHFPFSEKEARETWVYAFPLFHLSKSLKIGPQFGHVKKTWSSAEEFEDLTGKKFKESEEFFFTGLRILNVF